MLVRLTFIILLFMTGCSEQVHVSGDVTVHQVVSVDLSGLNTYFSSICASAPNPATCEANAIAEFWSIVGVVAPQAAQ